MIDLRRLLKIIFGTIAAILSIILIYMLFAVILSLIPVNKNFQSAQNGIEIFIITNGIHAEFAFPFQSEFFEWEKAINLHDFGLKDTIPQYISFGWGDKKFYLETPTWDDLTVPNAMNALLWNSTPAMHLTLWKGRLIVGEKARKLRINSEQYEFLRKYIMDSFQKDKNGKFQLIPVPGYTHKDRFYEATGRYNGIRTCNTWVNIGLKKIGIKTSVWSPFDKGIFYHLN